MKSNLEADATRKMKGTLENGNQIDDDKEFYSFVVN